mmetsp:Transcript_3355/g.4883  ORF Transcript_3355/g.4883 Transcript_3355/m.4883 type:complete len:603 (+) Transcript_3355:247-2055(+)
MTSAVKIALSRRYRRFRRICRFIFIGVLSYLGFYTIQASSSADQNVRVGTNNNRDCAWKSKKSRHLHRPTSIYPRGGASLQQYRDVLQIAQRSRLKKRHDFDDDSSFIDHWGSTPNGEGYLFSRNKLSKSEAANSSAEAEDGADSTTAQAKGIPVVYRYFGRSRARSVRSDSIPFIVIGPSVDHWKLVGRILASRGFNVMAIERVKKEAEDEASKGGKGRKKVSSDDAHALVEGEALVSTILNVLKWQRAILVGCDEESVLAIEAALRLAPDRIAGLVLCGDLSSFQKHVQEQINNMKNYSTGDDDDSIDIDSFLNHYVECPCSIVWDGDVTTWSSAGENYPSSSSIAKVIHGGGMAPHRRLPEQFAWTLTRFVEKKVSTLPAANDNIDATAYTEDTSITAAGTETGTGATIESQRNYNIWKEMPISQLFTPGSLLVSGRILATAIIYISIARVSVFQYKNIRDIQLPWYNLSRGEIVQNLFARIRRIKIGDTFILSFPKVVIHHLRHNFNFLRDKKKSGSQYDEGVEQSEMELVEEDDDEEDTPKSPAPDSHPSSPQEDNGSEENGETLKPDAPSYDNGDEGNGSGNPLLHKLLFFDHIIS